MKRNTENIERRVARHISLYTSWMEANQEEEDLLICGYIIRSDHVASLVLGKPSQRGLRYHGVLGVHMGNPEFITIIKGDEREVHPFCIKPPGFQTERAVWLEPRLVCRVQFKSWGTRKGERWPTYLGLAAAYESI
jgi:ATP-dependent DNA ligase